MVQAEGKGFGGRPPAMNPCIHSTYEKIREPQWVYGTPGWLPPRYECKECGFQWNDSTEKPPDGQGWKIEVPFDDED